MPQIHLVRRKGKLLLGTALLLRLLERRFTMTGKVTTAGQIINASYLRTVWNATNLVLALFKSNTTPALGDMLATYTESTFAGYARSTCTNWTAPTTVSAHARMTADAKTFTRSTTGAAENVYGYLVLESTGTFLIWAERDAAAPIVLTNAGDSYTVTPRYDLTTEF